MTDNKLSAKQGFISPYQLFFIFLVSRAVVALTFYQSVLERGVTPDSLISALLALFINLLICFPVLLCVKYEKNPLETTFGRIIYLAYFIFFIGVNISRFAFFACDKTTHGDNTLLFIILMSIAACYAAYLGIEALGRFSVICAIISIIVLIVMVLLDIKNFHLTNFMPFYENEGSGIIRNAFVFSSNSVEPALFLVLSGRCRRKEANALFWGISASYLAIVIMLLFCIGVLGKAASLYAFPVYTLFQMTAFKSFSRLDIFYTAFGFFALFAKCAFMLFCAAESVKRFSDKVKYPALFLISVVVSLIIYRRFSSEIINGTRWFYPAISLAFLVFIPLLFLVFKNKKGAKYEKIN